MSFQMSLDSGDSIYKITSYSSNGFCVSGEMHKSSIIISPNDLITDWPIQSVDELNAELILPILQLQPEIVIIGTGNKLKFPSTHSIKELVESNIGYEFMDTGAACRSYTILMSEGRKVAAALIYSKT